MWRMRWLANAAVFLLLCGHQTCYAQVLSGDGADVDVIVEAFGSVSSETLPRHNAGKRKVSRKIQTLVRLEMPAQRGPEQLLDTDHPIDDDVHSQDLTRMHDVASNATLLSATSRDHRHEVVAFIDKTFTAVLADALQFYPGPVDEAQATQNMTPHPIWVFQWSLVWNRHVLLCCVALFFSGVLCSAAGIGGGGIYVAVLMVLGRLSPHDAVPLSKAIVFFGAIASLVVNLGKSIFSSNQTNTGSESKGCIDLVVCRVVVPSLLIGTLLGVLLNWYTDDKTIAALLFIILTFMTVMVLRTAWLQYHEEVAGPPPAQQQQFVNPQEDETPPAAGSDGARRKEKQSQPDREDVIMGVALLFVVTLTGILRFYMHTCRGEIEANLPRTWCEQAVPRVLFFGNLERWMSTDYTAVFLQLMIMSLPLWTCGALSVYYAVIVCRTADWSLGGVILYQSTAVVTGLLAGLVGVGGGLILAPFFLLTGVDPFVSVSTSATCVIFTSSSTTIQYAFTNRIIASLAIVYGVVTSAASYTGTSLIHYFRDRFEGRRSYITLVVALSVWLSAILALGKLIALLEREQPATA